MKDFTFPNKSPYKLLSLIKIRIVQNFRLQTSRLLFFLYNFAVNYLNKFDMKSFKITNLFSNVGGFDKVFKAIENHEKKELMKNYKLADEVITAIAEKDTILIKGLGSDLEDRAVANGQNFNKFRADFAGLMKWLSTDLNLILYAGDNNGLVTLSEEGRYIYQNNLTIKEYIERKDKKRENEEATVKQNLINAQRQGVFLIVKIIGTCVGSILIPLAGFVANDIIRTTTIAIGSAIIGALWSTKIGRAIKSLIDFFVKNKSI